MRYRIKNGLLLMYDGDSFFIKKEDVFINEKRIEAIGSDRIKDSDKYEEVDAKDKLVIPGLINLHTHAYMNFMKNSADDISFYNWLNNRIFPIEAKMCKSDFYWTTLFGCMEMIKTGTTCYLDMHICENECARAAKESGMRAFLGKCITGKDLNSDAQKAFKQAINEKEEYESDLLKFVLSPHSVYACSSVLLKQISEQAQRKNMLKHIHLSESSEEVKNCISEYGKSPVELLDSIGFLDKNTIAAHCVNVSDKDITILKEKEVSVVTNPSSNAKLGNGIAPISKMLEGKVNVCLGTDSAASNNTLNMFREMSFYSLLHKASNKTAVDFSAVDVLKSVTVNPAKALHSDNVSGIISEGAYADLVFIDLNAVSLFPNNNILSSLCYSANGSEVDSVMINGKFVMKNGIITTIDTERVYYEVDRIAKKYILGRGLKW